MTNKFYMKKEARIPFTRKGYQDVIDQRSKLQSQRPEAVEHLRKAREMGDLSENGYYKASRARLSFLDAQLRKLERLVKLGVVVESSGSGYVDIGSTVTLWDGQKEYKYSVVGGYESNPSEQTISHKSPLGRALMGKRENETIEVDAPKGIMKYTIRKVG